MSGWTDTIYFALPSEEVARDMATALGAELPEDGSTPSGTANYALDAPIEEWITPPTWEMVDGALTMTDPGELRPGYCGMVKFNLATELGAAAHAQFLTLVGAYVYTPEAPSRVFAGDE